MNKNLGPRIIELKARGYSYNKIVSELKCSKSTVAYHLGKDQKEKTLSRQQRGRAKNPLIKKRDQFVNDKRRGRVITGQQASVRKILANKRHHFCKRRKESQYMFLLDDLENKVRNNPYCYLTGRKIDLSKSLSYHLDHIVPVSKGGDNSLENCGLSCREANQAKSDLLLDEFVKLCQEVVDRHEKVNLENEIK